MKRKNLKAEDLARAICRQEKIGYETVHFLAEALLCRYAKGSGLALKGPNNMSKEMIAKEKQRIRRRYIEIIGGIHHNGTRRHPLGPHQGHPDGVLVAAVARHASDNGVYRIIPIVDSIGERLCHEFIAEASVLDYVAAALVPERICIRNDP